MIKSILKTSLAICVLATVTACSESADSTDLQELEEVITEEISEPKDVEPEEETPFGNLAGIVGEWTVDAATAGVKMDLTFGEDGSFKQSMGPIQQEGNWTKLDDEHINVVTPNTKEGGQKWKVSNLTEDAVDFTWNLDKSPKTIPMTRVK